MLAWAIEMESASGMRSIFCVLAETKNEAFAIAFDELEDSILNAAKKSENPYKGKKVKDFSPSIWTYAEVPNGGKVSKTHASAGLDASGFADEIRR